MSCSYMQSKKACLVPSQVNWTNHQAKPPISTFHIAATMVGILHQADIPLCRKCASSLVDEVMITSARHNFGFPTISMNTMNTEYYRITWPTFYIETSVMINPCQQCPPKQTVSFSLSSAHSWNFEKSNQSIQGEHLAMPSTDPRCSSGAYFLPGRLVASIPGEKHRKTSGTVVGEDVRSISTMPRIWAK